MRIESVKPIAPVPSRCIEVASDDRLFASGGADGLSFVSHNSVAQRNIIFGCIMRPNDWKFLGIDLKRVELSAFRKYSNVVMGVATTLEDALLVLRFANETMMKRYTQMEQLGINNFLNLPDRGQALMVMIDEAGELLSPSGVKALSENTPIATPTGFKKLSELETGDKVLDLYGFPTVILNKYEPEEQTRFDMHISNDSTHETETIVAGAEHYWVAYFKHPDGEVEGPETVTTQYLRDFKLSQDELPENERVTVKFRRAC